MEPHNHNSTTRLLLEKLNHEIAVELLPALFWLGIFMVVGIIGNVLVLYAYKWKLRSCTQHFCIIWLALFDLISCVVVIPLEMGNMRYQLEFESQPRCRFLKFLDNYFAYCSVLTLTIIAADRYRKVCQPFKRQITVKAARRSMVVIVLISALLTVPAVLLFGIKPTEIKSHAGVYGHTCSIVHGVENSFIPQMYAGIMFFVFGVASITITVFYISILQERRHRYLSVVNSVIISTLLESPDKISTRKAILVNSENLCKRLGLCCKKPRKTIVETPPSRPRAIKPEPALDQPSNICLENKAAPGADKINTAAHIVNDDVEKTSLGTPAPDEFQTKGNLTCSPEDADVCNDEQCDYQPAQSRLQNKENRGQNLSDTVCENLKTDRLETCEERKMDSMLPPPQSVFLGVPITIKQLGTNSPIDSSDLSFFQNSTEPAQTHRENAQGMRQTLSDNIHCVHTSGPDDIDIAIDQPPFMDKSIQDRCNVNLGTSENVFNVNDTTDLPTTPSPEPVSCHSQQTAGNEENITRNVIAGLTIQEALRKRKVTRFDNNMLPVGDSADSTLKTPTATTTTTTAAPSLAVPSSSRILTVFKAKTEEVAQAKGGGSNTLLPAVPVVTIRSCPSVDNSSINNVVGHIRMTARKAVPAMERDRVTKTAITISAVFLISFVPFMILITLRLFVVDFEDRMRGGTHWLYSIFIRSFYLSFVSNPIIYAKQNTMFKKVVKRLLRRSRSSESAHSGAYLQVPNRRVR